MYDFRICRAYYIGLVQNFMLIFIKTVSDFKKIWKSPCSPNGKHNYDWTASAKAKKSIFSGTIAKAKESKYYP